MAFRKTLDLEMHRKTFVVKIEHDCYHDSTSKNIKCGYI